MNDVLKRVLARVFASKPMEPKEAAARAMVYRFDHPGTRHVIFGFRKYRFEPVPLTDEELEAIQEFDSDTAFGPKIHHFPEGKR